jgi:hypothetical protein
MLVLRVFRGLEVNWLELAMALHQNDLHPSQLQCALYAMNFYVFL